VKPRGLLPLIKIASRCTWSPGCQLLMCERPKLSCRSLTTGRGKRSFRRSWRWCSGAARYGLGGRGGGQSNASRCWWALSSAMLPGA